MHPKWCSFGINHSHPEFSAFSLILAPKQRQKEEEEAEEEEEEEEKRIIKIIIIIIKTNYKRKTKMTD